MSIFKGTKRGLVQTIEIGAELMRPMAEVQTDKQIQNFGLLDQELEAILEPVEIDTQQLMVRAAEVMENDPNRALFAKIVMIEFDAGRLSPEKADYYLTHPTER